MLREHCEREGRNYDEIEKTVMFPFDLGENGEKIDATIEAFARAGEAGPPGSPRHRPGRLEDHPLQLIGREIGAAAAGL